MKWDDWSLLHSSLFIHPRIYQMSQSEVWTNVMPLIWDQWSLLHASVFIHPRMYQTMWIESLQKRKRGSLKGEKGRERERERERLRDRMREKR